jgi:hypothetical protein
MDIRIFLNNFPWNRFGTVYETSSKELKNRFIRILDGTAESNDYKYIIENLEHQITLYRITPWGLKVYIFLLTVEKVDKNILLQNIKTLFEAANYNNKVDIASQFNPTKGNLAKYEQIKLKLFDDEFDGKMDAEYIKTFKAIDRHFMQISIIEYISKKKQLFETFTNSNDLEIAKTAQSLISSINNPKKYKFLLDDGVEKEY